MSSGTWRENTMQISLAFNKELCLSQPGSVFIHTPHNTSWWQPTGQWTLASKNLCLYEHCFSHQRRENTTGLQLCMTLDIQETLQVVSFLAFSARKTPWICFMHLYTPQDANAAKMMIASSRAHPQLHCVKFWSKLDWQFPRYSHFCITPLLRFSQSAPDHPAPETWPQNQHQCHNNSSPSLPRQLPMLLPVCWQLGQHQSACLPTTGTPKMHTTPSPYFAIPWRTGSSSTAYHQIVRTTSGMSLQP